MEGVGAGVGVVDDDEEVAGRLGAAAAGALGDVALEAEDLGEDDLNKREC